MNFGLLPFTLQPRGLWKPTRLLCSQQEPSLCDLFVGKLARGWGQGRICIYNHHFQDTICISNRQKKTKKQNSPTLMSPTHLCYKLSQDLGSRLGPQIPMDKEKKESRARMWSGIHGVDGVWEEAKTKKMYKPDGHLSSPGTKMFQSQNISLVEFQGFREKSKLKRGSQTYTHTHTHTHTYIYVYIYIHTHTYIYIIYIYIIYRLYSTEKKKETMMSTFFKK